MTRKGVVKERLLEIISETTHVAILRRVSRFQLQLSHCPEAIRGRGGEGDRPTPMVWGWCGMELGCDV